MSKQPYWEDIQEGDEVTPLVKIATTQMLVKWAGACGDFVPLHYDHHYMQSIGLEKPIIHGGLKRAWMIQMVTDWAGDPTTLKKFSLRYRLMDYPREMKTTREPEEGETWWSKGKVDKKYVADGKHYVDCDAWVENGKGEVTTQGRATLVLPSKG